MYANQGKLSDFEHLNKTIDLKGTIAIVRYGGAGRSTKVRLKYFRVKIAYRTKDIRSKLLNNTCNK